VEEDAEEEAFFFAAFFPCPFLSPTFLVCLEEEEEED